MQHQARRCAWASSPVGIRLGEVRPTQLRWLGSSRSEAAAARRIFPGVEASRELRLVTCLFIDVVGSTDATVRLGPERMQRLLRDAFREMSGIVVVHGGVVEKFIGDAILALFGAEVSRADDAEQALRAADACVQWSAGAVASGTGLGVRAGVETGELLVDPHALETQQRMVLGESINLAARIQQLAEPGQIVVGPNCHEATATVAGYEPLGQLNLKGLGEVEVWRFTGFADQPSGGVELVGREAELASLAAAFEEARGGRATLALVVGPPGQGKSRLVAEAVARGGAHKVLEARCRPGTETGANSPVRQLLESDVPGATADTVLDRLTQLLGPAEGAEIARPVNHGAGLAADDQLLAIPRYEQRELIANAWRRYVEALAGEQPLVVVVEDVHWGDPLLLRIVDRISADLAAPLIVLATARPEFEGTAHLRPRDNRLRLELAPLDDASVVRLGELAGAAAGSAALDRAAGNPLFVIELARSRARRGAIPVTIQAAIAARIDELAAPERDLIQRVAVAGETFGVRDAALLGDREPGEVAAALGRFAHLAFVTQVGSSYRFHHALVHDVAYGRLPVAERMALHARYARDGLDPGNVEALAHHWWEALKPPDADWVWEDRDALALMRRDAFGVHMAAGERLADRNLYEQAEAIFARAVELADAIADRANAEARTGWAAARQGKGDDAWTHRLAALALHREAGSMPPAQLYADMLEITTFNWGWFKKLPDDADVLRLLNEGIDVATASGDDVSRVRLLAERASFTGDVSGTDDLRELLARPDAIRFADGAQRMALVYAWNGRIRDAVEVFETVFERLIPAGARINYPEALAWYAMAAFYSGDLARADELAELIRIDALQRSVHTQSHAYSVKGLIAFGRGDWDGLRREARDLWSLATANPDVPMCLLSAATSGYAAAAQVLAGEPLPADIDEQAQRHVADSERVRAASVMLAKAAVGDAEGVTRGLTGYEPDLRLWDRIRAWDVADLIPGISLTILERWDDLGPFLARLDACAAGGARLAAAAAAGFREEHAAASGGPAPRHEELEALGYNGISELLRFRPATVLEPAVTAKSR
jgi:class 3 adenylate cyclase/tetratricopeptide (TPR) repeat protein